MAITKDILLDDDGDLMARNGDFVIGDSSHQNQKLIILSQKGEWKQNPLVGVGLEDFINDDSGVQELHKEIQRQLEADGATVKSITGESIDTNVDASYE